METLKEKIITVEDIKAEIERAKLEVPREDEDFDDRYDRLHAEWAVKGLKKYSDELKEIYINVFTLLDRKLSQKVEYSDTHSFECYVDLEDEWEYL